MKNKSFQKSKKLKPFDDDKDLGAKKVGSASSKKEKYFKKEIFDEIDEFEDIDLYGTNNELDEDELDEAEEIYDEDEEDFEDDEDEEDDEKDSDY